MKLHLVLLALAALLVVHACTSQAAREEVNGVPVTAPKDPAPKARNSSGHGVPASSRAACTEVEAAAR